METKSQLTTLCYIEKDGKYLMLHRVKKEKDVNKDKWIGVGGHFEEGESPEECLLREVKEETGLSLTSFRFRGLVTFLADGWQSEYMCLYTADGFEGEISACNEGTLEWVDKKEVLHLNLWEGDKVFFRLLEERETFFSLKLSYEGDRLVQCVLDGQDLELIDIRKADGSLTGQVRERTLVHRDGDIHGTSHVWIVRKNGSVGQGFDILLQQRSDNKDSYPGCYDISSAGHVPAGCGYLDSAVRELREELGIEAAPEELHFAFWHEGRSKEKFYGRLFINNEISRVYLFDDTERNCKLKLQEEEVTSVLWIDYDSCIRRMEEGEINHCIYMDEFRALGKAARRLLYGEKEKGL